MSEIVVLDKSQLEEMLQRAGRFAASIVLEKAEKVSSELMTKQELAVYLRCDISKINRLMKKDLPFFMFGETPRFRKSDIDNWLKKN
jgi:excisionase family DNA binding protein